MVDDDRQLRDLVLLPGLRDHGFVVTGLGSAAELQSAMRSCQFDIVVLDLGLPDADGLDLTKRIRPDSDIGIIMLTGRNDEQSRIRGLTVGADGFLTKPVTIDVLAASLTSLGRRLDVRSTAIAPTGAETAASRWHLAGGGWRLVAPNGVRIVLTRNERGVLSPLMATPGEPVSRERLIANLTDDASGFDPHRLEMLIHRLRTKIGKHWPGDNPLQAVRGIGYLFVADDPANTVVAVSDPTAARATARDLR